MSKKFQDALRAWRKSRPEHAELVKAIKSGKPNDVLRALAGDAGCPLSEVSELQNLRHRATRPDMKKRAGTYDRLQSEVATLTEQVQAADKGMQTAATMIERDRYTGDFYNLVEKLQKQQMALADAHSAHSCVETAKEFGVF